LDPGILASLDPFSQDFGRTQYWKHAVLDRVTLTY
jgi:hypothetical protein